MYTMRNLFYMEGMVRRVDDLSPSLLNDDTKVKSPTNTMNMAY